MGSTRNYPEGMVKLLAVLASLPSTPSTGAGAALGAVLLLARLRDEHPAAARTLLHGSAADHSLSEMHVRSGHQIRRALREQEDARAIRRNVQLDGRRDAEGAALQ